MKKTKICTCLFSGACFLSSASAMINKSDIEADVSSTSSSSQSAMRGIPVDAKYEIQNRLIGMKADIISRVVGLIKDDSKKRPEYGISTEQQGKSEEQASKVVHPIRVNWMPPVIVNWPYGTGMTNESESKESK